MADITTEISTAIDGEGADFSNRMSFDLSLLDASDRHLDVAAQSETRLPRDYGELYQGCIQARDELIQTANKYRKKVGQPAISASTTHSWTELDEGVAAACCDLEKLAAQDAKRMPGLTGKMKQAFRSLCRHAGAGQTVISLIPGDAFGFSSALCGGFKVVFSALHQTALYREDVFRALEELPSLLQDSSELCGAIVFRENPELHRRRSELYSAVFQALKQILLWFVKNSFGRFALHFFGKVY